jgi:hypothetical protein
LSTWTGGLTAAGEDGAHGKDKKDVLQEKEAGISRH